MHVGGKPTKTSLSKNDKLICESISPHLKAKGLFFVGIDVIGNYLTEINVDFTNWYKRNKPFK